MHQTSSSAVEGAADGDARGLIEARDACWRMSHTIHSLQDTIAVLRVGANSLAIDNAILRLENERLRDAERARERAAFVARDRA